MIDTKQLRHKLLDLAIRGKLVPQDPNDDPASVLLKRIRAEKEKDRRNILLLFKEASILFPRFNDPDTEFTQSYCNDNRFLTQFSLDTDWVKALAYVREKLGLPAK